MNRHFWLRAAAAVSVITASSITALPTGCAGTTGGKRFSFDAKIGGIARDRVGPFTFVNERGWTITLTKADVTLGPVYLNIVTPLSGGQETSGQETFLNYFVKKAYASGDDHLEGGRVVGEVLAQVKFSALSSDLVTFPSQGTISEEPVRTTDLWFYPAPGVSPDTTKIDTVALDVAGTASQGSTTLRFRGALILNDAWLSESTSATQANQSIASIRRLRGIASSFLPKEGGALEVRVDVRALFRGADFSNLELNPSDADGTKVLVQSKTGKVTTDQVMTNLYQGLRSSTGTFTVRWVPKT